MKINISKELKYSICEELPQKLKVRPISMERIKKWNKKISVKVCLGTTCFVMGSSNLQELIDTVPAKYGDKVEVSGVLAWVFAQLTGNFQKPLM